jgi:hydroxyacylglutathione hydrolase
MAFSIDIIPAFTDNYIYLVSDSDIGLAMVVDPGESEPVLKILKERDLHLALILNTHHHRDHIGGSEKLQKVYGAPVIGPTKEKGRIAHMSRGVGQGDLVTFSTLRGRVIETRGHTTGHIVFYFPEIKALFCGDTLFSLGCGKLFEGTAAEMWASLSLLRDLPDDTQIYCGHEYTEDNAKFAMAVDKNNVALKNRAAEVTALRKLGKPTLPSSMGVEKQTNPFLRIDAPDLQKELAKNGVAVQGTDPAALFGMLRTAKDRFGT